MVTQFNTIRSNRWMCCQPNVHHCCICGSKRLVMNRVLMRWGSKYFVNCEECNYHALPARSLKRALKIWNRLNKEWEEAFKSAKDR